MKIKVFGCGHIGAINAYCLSQLGNEVEVYDKSGKRTQDLLSRKPLFHEHKLNWEEFYNNIHIANYDSSDHDLALICIDAKVTDGKYDIEPLKKIVLEQAGMSVPSIIRTTIGGNGIKELKEFCGDNSFSFTSEVSYWPEFLREGSAIEDFLNDKNFLATIIEGSSLNLNTKKFFKKLGFNTEYEILACAESLAYTKMYSNAFRALKLTFANSIALSAGLSDMSRKEFKHVFSQLRGNCDSSYLRAGDPFGGYCLPKETYAAGFELSKVNDNANNNIFYAANSFNENLVHLMSKRIIQSGVLSVGFFGLEFKKGTSDQRGSPYLMLKTLLGDAGIDIEIGEFDKIYNCDGIFLRDFDDELPMPHNNVFRFLDLYN